MTMASDKAPLPQNDQPAASTVRHDGDIAGGVYVHIPFCRHKCAYCDFYSVTDAKLHRPYVTALKRELASYDDAPFSADSLYLGGGTPSVLAAPLLAEIMDALQAHLDLSPSSEITVEANPGHISHRTMLQYRSMGINRISVGVQSFQEPHLQFLGRRHTAEQAREAIVAARKAGFTDLGLDLIYALPGQHKAQWLRDLKEVLRFQPEHLSCYLLSFEPGTPLDDRRRRGEISPLADDTSAALFHATAAFLTSQGYDHYEVSSFARIEQHHSHRSRHNQKYWSGAPYLGFGPSAHSFRNGVRHWNVRSVPEYIKRLGAQRSPVVGYESLTRRQKMLETLYLSLRRSEGLAFLQFEKRFHTNLRKRCTPLVRALEAEGLLRQTHDHWALTPAGMVRADGIVQQMAAQMGLD
jgi:oxygen-independent coproporphyrinogen-3 oxidase